MTERMKLKLKRRRLRTVRPGTNDKESVVAAKVAMASDEDAASWGQCISVTTALIQPRTKVSAMAEQVPMLIISVGADMIGYDRTCGIDLEDIRPYRYPDEITSRNPKGTKRRGSRRMYRIPE
jgi:hypothetical protein